MKILTPKVGQLVIWGGKESTKILDLVIKVLDENVIVYDFVENDFFQETIADYFAKPETSQETFEVVNVPRELK